MTAQDSTPTEDPTPNPDSTTDRQALIASLGFPLLVLLGGLIGFAAPSAVTSISSWVTPLLGVIMFGMGLTLKPHDFALVAKRPLPVIIGVVAQFVIMPLLALLVVVALDLPNEIAVGVILVGCSPGGTASNVVSYEVPRVLFLGLCLVFHYFSTGVVFPKIGFYFSRRAVAQALVEP